MKHYEEVRELTTVHHYKVGSKIEEVPRAEVKAFLEENPDAVFVKKEYPAYRSWIEMKENSEKFPLINKGLKAVKEKVIKK